MYMNKNTDTQQKRREGIFIKRCLVRAAKAQSAKLRESRFEAGSFSDFANRAVAERLARLGVNVTELLRNG
jgi:hypothetical protein